jgi:hypothetical protein
MSFYEKLIVIYPQLSMIDFGPRGTIRLQNDSDGRGDYIASWAHELPQPTEEQLQGVI